MVQAHARLAKVPNVRSTDDADIVVGLDAGHEYRAAANAIGRLGFQLYESLDSKAPSYRFVRGHQHIDLMVPDRSAGARFGRRPVRQVPASDSAMKRTETYETSAGSVIRIPDVTGALSLKGAAFELPSDNPVRHLQDAVVLFACAGVRGAPAPSKSMKANINRLIIGLETRPEAWSLAEHNMSRLAIRGVRLHFREDWVPPTSAGPTRFVPPTQTTRGRTVPGTNSGSFR